MPAAAGICSDEPVTAASPTRKVRPADPKLQEFLKEIDLGHLQEALWDESLFSCLKVLETEARVGFISWLANKQIGPQPVRQKLTNGLAKAQRAGRFGRVTPPAWDYVPPMPQDMSQARSRPSQAANPSHLRRSSGERSSPPRSRDMRSPSSTVVASSPRTPPRSSSGGLSIESRYPLEQPAEFRSDQSLRGTPSGPSSPLPALAERSNAWLDRRAACSPPVQGTDHRRQREQTTGLLSSVTSLWHRLTRTQPRAMDMQTPQQVTLGML